MFPKRRRSLPLVGVLLAATVLLVFRSARVAFSLSGPPSLRASGFDGQSTITHGLRAEAASLGYSVFCAIFSDGRGSGWQSNTESESSAVHSAQVLPRAFDSREMVYREEMRRRSVRFLESNRTAFGTSRACGGSWRRMGFNEKVRFRMGHDRRPILPVLVDKTTAYAFAALAAEFHGLPVATYEGPLRGIVGPGGSSKPNVAGGGALLLPGVLYSGPCAGLPSVESLPPNFVFKARHASGCNLIVVNRTIVAHRPCLGLEMHLGGLRPTDRLLSAACRAWTSKLYSTSEWAYSRIKPGILVEAYLHGPGRDTAGGSVWAARSVPDDIKCFTYGGQTRFVAHVTNRWAQRRGAKTDTFYSRDTRPLPGVSYQRSKSIFSEKHCGDRACQASPQMKKTLLEAVRVCDVLGKAFDFMRIDMLLTDRGLVFGEMTPYPGGGAHKWRPTSFDSDLSSAWRDCAA